MVCAHEEGPAVTGNASLRHLGPELTQLLNARGVLEQEGEGGAVRTHPRRAPRPCQQRLPRLLSLSLSLSLRVAAVAIPGCYSSTRQRLFFLLLLLLLELLQHVRVVHAVRETRRL